MCVGVTLHIARHPLALMRSLSFCTHTHTHCFICSTLFKLYLRSKDVLSLINLTKSWNQLFWISERKEIERMNYLEFPVQGWWDKQVCLGTTFFYSARLCFPNERSERQKRKEKKENTEENADRSKDFPRVKRFLSIERRTSAH